MNAEVLNVVCAVIGLALGWYLRRQSIGVPQDVLDAVKKLLAQKQQQDGHSVLKDLLGSLPPAGPPRS